jgi:hypothetical protein
MTIRTTLSAADVVTAMVDARGVLRTHPQVINPHNAL